VIIREIQRSEQVAQLADLRERAEQLLYKYLHQEVSIAYIAEIMSQVNDAIIERAIELALENRSAPPVAFCWLGLGSEGRKEQLLRTDQDNALVFADVEKEAYEEVKAYFLDLAREVTASLEACGFEYCPAEMMASNPRWCLSLSQWEQQFSHWIFEPGNQEILYANIFFDYRPVYGHTELAQALTEHIFECLDGRQLFLNFMAQHATKSPPPLSFFRNFIVEDDGEHKDEFALKKRAMMPLTDIARILTLEARLPGINSTIERFERLAELNDENKAVFEMAADAYEVLMRIRALQGLKNKDSGRFVRTEDLTKMQRVLLRNSFRPVKKLQETLRLRFQLNFFG
jgi:CBS domain-containing protein